MTYIDQLIRLHQEHLLTAQIAPEELLSIDWHTLEKLLQEVVHTPHDIFPVTPTGASPYAIHPVPFFYRRRLGVLIMAGGQATRLKNHLPKGVIPFSPIFQKSIFQIIAEKIGAFSACYDATVHTAIMTSDATDGATKAHFSLHNNFSLPSLDFFVQDSLPLLDMDKQLILHQDHILKGPDGNGKLFHTFVNSGLMNKWKEAGVEAIAIINCDNPLIDPFHPGLFFPLFQGHDLAAAAIERTDPAEHVGLYASDHGRLTVVEYSEIDPEKASSRDAQGKLLFRWANISFFACLPEFVEKAATCTMPLHMAKKHVLGKEVWKAEYFIFDTLCKAQNPSLVPIEREEYFAPVKSTTGPTSIVEVQKAVMIRDKTFLQKLGKIPEEGPIELPQSVFYPRKDWNHPVEEKPSLFL